MLLAEDATVYVRTDKREFTYRTTVSVLRQVFPEERMRTMSRPFRSPTQTHLLGDNASKDGDVDIVLAL